MKKQDVIDMFGGVKKAAFAFDMTYQGVHGWPDELSQQTIDRLVGVLYRRGLDDKAEELRRKGSEDDKERPD